MKSVTRWPATMQPELERGATAVEYGLLLALVAAVIVGVVTTLGTRVLASFNLMLNTF